MKWLQLTMAVLVFAVSAHGADLPVKATKTKIGNSPALAVTYEQILKGGTNAPIKHFFGSAQIAVGETLEIRLGGNPTTGYAWTLEALDESIAAATGPLTYEQKDAEAGMVGVPGTYSMSVRGASPGYTYLRLRYKRAWEKSATCTLAVRIRVVP